MFHRYKHLRPPLGFSLRPSPARPAGRPRPLTLRVLPRGPEKTIFTGFPHFFRLDWSPSLAPSPVPAIVFWAFVFVIPEENRPIRRKPAAPARPTAQVVAWSKATAGRNRQIRLSLSPQVPRSKPISRPGTALRERPPEAGGSGRASFCRFRRPWGRFQSPGFVSNRDPCPAPPSGRFPHSSGYSRGARPSARLLCWHLPLTYRPSAACEFRDAGGTW